MSDSSPSHGPARFDVLTIGNAIVDIIAQCDDAFLARETIAKGAMNLIDAERAEHLYAAMGPATEASGGSAANTAAGVASLGGRAAYFGKVADDQLGTIFAHDIRAAGAHFDTAPLPLDGPDVPPTARSMIFVTPDGERSMNTYLGACVELGPEDVEADVAAGAHVTYFEGYLWDPPRAKDAIRRAAAIAHENGRRVAMTLSDAFCVERWRDEFLDLMRSGTVDLVFGNEVEACALYETDDLDAALARLREDCDTAVVTRSEHGCVVVGAEGAEAVPAHPVERVVDSTGAGDLFAAGYLHALTRGRPAAECARLGALAAAEAISHVGPRPQVKLAELAREHGLNG